MKEEKHPMDTLMKQSAAVLLKPGELVAGRMLFRRGPRLFLDLGPAGTGVVYAREFSAAEEILKNLQPGDEISAKVVAADNEEGYVELSLAEAGRERDFQEIKKIFQERQVLKLQVKEANRGGLIMEYRGLEGFLPASQLAPEHYPRVEGGDKEKIYEELKKLVGQELEVTILDLDSEEDKLIFSEKSKFADELRRELAKYHVGDAVEGTISGVVSFGAFVRFGPKSEADAARPQERPQELEGLVHISEIDWQLIQNPADVLKVGDRVKAKIIGLEGERVSLSLKALKENPWLRISEKVKKGDVLTGTVVKFNPFGAFVRIDDVVQGLAHISEFGSEAKMKEVLALGKSYEFKVLAIDPEEHRLALGLVRPEFEAAAPASAAESVLPGKAE